MENNVTPIDARNRAIRGFVPPHVQISHDPIAALRWIFAANGRRGSVATDCRCPLIVRRYPERRHLLAPQYLTK
jgi:hypothetical protein